MKSSMQNKHVYLEGYLPDLLQGQKEKIIKLSSILLAAAAGIQIERWEAHLTEAAITRRSFY